MGDKGNHEGDALPGGSTDQVKTGVPTLEWIFFRTFLQELSPNVEYSATEGCTSLPPIFIPSKIIILICNGWQSLSYDGYHQMRDANEGSNHGREYNGIRIGTEALERMNRQVRYGIIRMGKHM